MPIYTKELRSRMKDELLDAGDQLAIDYDSKRHGAFESFRQTVRYVARSINMKIATDRFGEQLIVTRVNPEAFTVDYMEQVPKLRFTRRDMDFFAQRLHLLEPRQDDPLYDLKRYLTDYFRVVKTVMYTNIEQNEKDGLYNEEQ